MNRIIFQDNTSLIDFTTELNNYRVGSKVFNYTVSQDALYIGSRLPFNHIYVKLKELNANAATMTVQYWSGAWENVVELKDDTSGFTQSGYITWVPDKDDAWEIEDTDEGVTGLTTLTIYDMYWIKITFNATLTNTTELAWIGQVFSDDYDLGAEYPELTRPNSLTSFEPGKTDWQEQHVKAAEIVVQDLIDRQIIEDKAQILNRRDYINSSVQKVAELIFKAFGDDYVDQRQAAREEYLHRISKKIHRVDLNQNAVEDISERKNTSGWLSR